MKGLGAFFAVLLSAGSAHAYLKAGPVGYGHWLKQTTPQEGMATSLSAAYSFRKVRSAYAGSAVKLRRVDTTTQDIGFTAGGDFDTAAAATFCTTACTVQTWFDQSGNARDAVNATPANQPAYIANCIGDKPCARTTAGAMRLATAGSITPTATGTYNVVAKVAAASATQVFMLQVGAQNALFSNTGNSWVLGGAAVYLAAPAADGGWHTATGTYNGASSVLNVDGVETTGAMTSGLGAGTIQVVATNGSPSDMTEAFVWQGYVLTADERAALSQNQRNYWTPLPLDNFATPAAAYSMRKLKSSYSGPAIRLRRASDNAEADIGFLGYTGFTGAPIDTVAANAHCAAASCFTKTVYDQSGNARDATQATPANQPAFIFNCNGTLPCLRDTAGQNLASASFTPSAKKTMSVVGRRSVGTVGCYWVISGAANILTASGAGFWVIGDGATSITAAAAEEAWHTGIGVMDGASSVLRIDAGELGGTIAGSTAAGPVYVTFGAVGATCDVSEAIVWDNYALTAAERAALAANQHNFWGF